MTVCVGGVFGAVRTWDRDAGTDDWNTALNWSGDTVPIAGDDVVFDGGFVANNIAVPAVPPNYASFTIDNSSTTGAAQTIILSGNLSITGAVSLTANGTLDLAGNTLSAGGNIILTGGTFTPGGGTVEMTGNVTTINA